MSFRQSLVALGVALAFALPAAALDPASMTPEERAAFRAEVRAYLLENPEVLMEAIGVLEQRQSEAQAAGDVALVKANSDALLNDPNSWITGNPQGDITVVEFIDYRCSYCRRAHDEDAALLKADTNVRLIVKEFPILGEDSVTSSRFAIAVRQLSGDAAYEKAHEALIKMTGPMNPPRLLDLAAEIGVDGEAVLARMAAPEVTAVIAANRALGERLQINGTPTFVIAEALVRGYVPVDGMLGIVAQQRAQN